MSVSLRSAVVLVAIAASAFTATLAAAHDHHHDGDHDHHHEGNAWHFFGSWADKQNMSAALQDCLCWNTTTQTWCHSSMDGPNTGFWRDSCQRVVYYNYFWVVFAVLWMIWLAVIPLFTCIFRICCNCCGGRNPSYGCCCPYSNKLMSQDPNFKRPYSRCQTFTAKILALIMLIAFIDLSVHAFVSNHQVSDRAISGAQALQTSVSALQDTYLSVMSLEKTEAFKRLNTTTNSTTSQGWFQVDLSSIEFLFNKYNKRVTDVQNGINKFEDHQHEYRSSPTIKLVAVPLAFVVVITLLGMCNVRSWPISISAGLISIVGIVFIVAASVTVALGIGMGTVCNHQDVVKNFTKQILTNRGCNMYSVTEQINATEIAFVNTLCKNGLNASSGICTGNNMFTNTSAGFIGVNVVNMTDVALAVNSTKNSTVVALWTNFSSLFQADSPLATLFRDNYKCNIVDTQFDTVLEPALCQGKLHVTKHGHHHYSNTVSSALTGLGGLLFGLALACTFTYWVWVYGAKRFTKSSTKEEILAAHHQFLYPVADGSGDQWAPYQPAVGDVEAQEKPAAPLPTAQPATAAVAATTEQPLLLSHQTPNYSSAQPSVNNKQQPEPIDQV